MTRPSPRKPALQTPPAPPLLLPLLPPPPPLLLPLLALLTPAPLLAAEKAEPGTLTRTALSLFETGGPLMYPLALCSCAVIWLAVYNAIELRRSAFAPAPFLAALVPALHRRDLQAARDLAARNRSRLARVLSPALEKVALPLASDLRPQAEAACQEAWDLELVKIQFWLNLLSTIAALSPMLGLLGTVSGMIKAFSKIGLGGMGKPELLAGDIGEALITTAAGLVVGIPAMVLFFVLKSRLDLGESGLFRTLTYLLDLCQELPYARLRAAREHGLPEDPPPRPRKARKSPAPQEAACAESPAPTPTAS